MPGSTANNSPQTVSVINTAAALTHRPATAAAVPGLSPRDLSYHQTAGQIMLANFNSGSVEEFPVPGA